MSELDKLLEDNYQTLKDPRCKEAVLEFIESHDSLKGLPISFIKKITKVTHNILTAEPECLSKELELVR